MADRMLILSEEEHEVLCRIVMTFGVYLKAEDRVFREVVRKITGPYIVRDSPPSKELVDEP